MSACSVKCSTTATKEEKPRYEYGKHETVVPDIMHYINKSQGGLGIEENGVLGCRYHHGLLDNGNLGLRPEMLEIMKEHLMQQYPDWSKDKLVYKKWDFPTFG